MIRISQPVAATPNLLVYEDDEDPAQLYYLPRRAELCRASDGAARFEQRMLRSGGAAGPGVSCYRWSVRGVIPDAEREELRGAVAEARGRPVRLEMAPLWPTLGVTILGEGAWDLLLCRAELREPELREVGVALVAPDAAEPALAERLMDAAGVEMSLELRVTGAVAPFRGSMEANFAAVRAHLLAAFPARGLVSWPRVAGEVETLVSSGAIRLRVHSGAADASAAVDSASRQVVNRLMLLQRFPPRPVPHPVMYASSFRVGERAEPDRWETIELVEPDLETRVVPVSMHVGPLPADAFHGLNGAYQELTQPVAMELVRDGLPIRDLPL